MTPTTALLFQTHFFNRGAARLFDKLRRQCPPGFECFVLLHAAPGTPKPRRLAAVPHHFVTTPEVRALPYPRKNGEPQWTGKPWHFWGGGHCDLVPLHFYNAHPHYDRYWMMEYDVRFTGNWRSFFDAFEGSASDFLSTSIRRRRDNPDWSIWVSLEGPAPEAGIERHHVAAFTPIFRASQAAMARMDAAYRAGWGGHIEGAWATVLDFHRLALEDIGGDGEFVRPGNRHRFYTAAKPNAECEQLAPGTVMSKPSLFRPGSTPNRLYHPVKTADVWMETEIFSALRAWQGAKRRELFARARGAARTARG